MLTWNVHWTNTISLKLLRKETHRNIVKLIWALKANALSCYQFAHNSDSFIYVLWFEFFLCFGDKYDVNYSSDKIYSTNYKVL